MPLETIVFNTLAFLFISLIFSLYMYYLYTQSRKKYLILWSLLWALLSLAYTIFFMMVVFELLVLISLYYLFLMMGVYVFHQATYEYLECRPFHAWRLAQMIIAVVFFTMIFIPQFFLITPVIMFVLIALFYGVSGWLFLRTKNKLNQVFGSIVLILSFLNLLYPFVIDYDVVSQIVTVFSGVFGITMGILMIALHESVIRREAKNIHDKLYYMSFHDSMTKLHNRAYLESVFNEINQEDNYPISLIMFDLNNLKKINDIHGHQYGDEMIKTTAKLISKNRIKASITVRYGGDEFVIVSPNTPYDKAVLDAENLKVQALLHEIMNEPISISYGVATKTTSEIQMNELLIIAEEKMYEQKRSTTIE